MSDELVPFTCALCGGTFDSPADYDEEAQLEALEQFGKRGDAPSMVVVCEPCYHVLMTAADRPEVEH